MNIVETIICLIALGLGVYQDVKSGEMDSNIFLAVTGIGLIVEIFNIGQIGLGEYFLRLGLIVLLFLTYEYFMGGGDAKLLMLIAMWAGSKKMLCTLFVALLVLLIVNYFKNPKNMKEILKRNFYAVIGQDFTGIRRDDPYVTHVIFAPYILCGFIVSLLFFGI